VAVKRLPLCLKRGIGGASRADGFEASMIVNWCISSGIHQYWHIPHRVPRLNRVIVLTGAPREPSCFPEVLLDGTETLVISG
jgi:hypothetical protein